MGINFQAGHPADILSGELGNRVAQQLAEKFGAEVPLGAKGEVFCLRDEMGWSWWSELQQLATQRLGAAACPQILGSDAWCAVYINTQMNRDVLWPDGPPKPKPKPTPAPAKKKVGFWKLLTGKRDDVPDELRQALDAMVKQFGARSGDQGGVQVGSLPRLMAELESVLKKLNVEPVAGEVEKLMKSYSEDDSRVDDDPAIQCLCHAWLSATHALSTGSPLWLVK